MNKQTYWEKVSSDTRWGKYIDKIETDFIQLSVKYCYRHNNVVEIGCDSAKWLNLVGKNFKNNLGTDVNHKSLTIAKLNHSNINLITVDPNTHSLPIKDNCVDLLLVIGVVPVIHSLWFYSEAKRVLNNNGVLVAVVTNKNSLRGFLYNSILKKKRMKSKAYSDLYSLSYTQSFLYWKTTLITNGFTILKEKGYCWFPFRRGSNSVFIPFFNFFEKYLGLQKITSLSPWIIFIAKKRDSI